MDQTILTHLNQNMGNWENSWEMSKKLNLNHDDVVGGLKSLSTKQYIKLIQNKQQKFLVNKEGESYAQQGCPEFRLYQLLLQQAEGKLDKSEAQTKIGKEYSIALKNGMKTLFKLEKNELIAIKNDSIKDEVQEILQQMLKSDFFDNTFDTINNLADKLKLKKRKLYDVKNLTYYEIEKDVNFSDTIIVQKADLTMEDINKGVWENAQLFKELNLQAKGKELSSGGLHPLMKLRTQFRQILLEMGFKEMDTKKYVESSFWNFDSLFQPQQHPARDAHDTFFLKNPQFSEYKSEEMKDYVERVKQIHENGFENQNEKSYGWNYEWDIKESQKNILRTHTTAVSSRYLYDIAKKYKETGEFKAQKLFSVDRVFRNETLDATHLAEFHQVEGLIIGKNLGLPQLKCFIRDFFAKIGITQIKFKPAYNPYTEPSMEIFVYHPQLKKTIEIGNSGIFRPEMLKPMGLPDDVSVIAWGLSLERPAMIRFQCSNIRELLGDKVDIKSIKDSEVIQFV